MTTELTYKDAAPIYESKGWHPIPAQGKNGVPSGATGHRGTVTHQKIEQWMASSHWGNGNLSLRHQGTVGFDIDEYDLKTGYQQYLQIVSNGMEGEELPATFTSTARGNLTWKGQYQGSRQHFFRLTEEQQKYQLISKPMEDIEICQFHHRHSVVWPSINPKTKTQYQWYSPDNELTDIPHIDDIPYLPESWFQYLMLRKAKNVYDSNGALLPDLQDQDIIDLVDSLDDGPVDDALLEDLGIDFESGRYEAVRDALYRHASFAIKAPKRAGLKTLFNDIVNARLTSATASTPEDQRQGEVVKSYKGAVAQHLAWEAEHPSITTSQRAWMESRKATAVTDTTDITNALVVPTDTDAVPSLDDTPLTKWVANRVDGFLCWSSGYGWLKWDGKMWDVHTTDTTVENIVRTELEGLKDREALRTTDATRLKALSVLLNTNKIANVIRGLKGYVEVDPKLFDTKHDYLNVQNGIVHLPTKTLYSHSTKAYFTKITSAAWFDGYTHPDWTQALKALPDESTIAYMQNMLGQACTGYASKTMTVNVGGGGNGKTAIYGTVKEVLGTYATIVPDKALLMGANDHTTELTEFLGARFALIEETPQTGRLDIARVKKSIDTPTMKARRIGQDNIEWSPTHTLFLSTNYLPSVSDNDRGTWRRLRLINFPFAFKESWETLTLPEDVYGDSNLKFRLETNTNYQHEAVLSWLVDGAYNWFQMRAANQDVTPSETVRKDTKAWESREDSVGAFVEDYLEFDPNGKIWVNDLLQHFNQLHGYTGQHAWSPNRFAGQFSMVASIKENGIKKEKSNKKGLSRHPETTLSVPAQPWCWMGVKFKTESANNF